MTKYETIDTLPLDINTLFLYNQPTQQPDLVHLDDPATSVMADYTHSKPSTINENDNINNALLEMKVKNVHTLLVENNHGRIVGLIASEDILGEAPIQIIQDRRIKRSDIEVKLVMIPLQKIIAFNIDSVSVSRVGNIVNTLKKHSQHYALVIDNQTDRSKQILKGLFNTSQIGKQLHHEINLSNHVGSVSKITKNKGKK